MTATTVIAIYAAVVASCGFAWQVYTYRRNERLKREEDATKVGVHVSLAIVATDPPLHAISVRFVNLSKHRINVTSVTFAHQEREGWDFASLAFVFGKAPPQAVESRDAGEVMFDRAKLGSGDERMDFHKPVVARVHLSTGELFESKPVTLRRD